VFLVIGVLFVVYAATLPIVLWSDGHQLLGSSQRIDYLVLLAGFGIAVLVAFYHVPRVLCQYTQALHDLSTDDAEAVTSRLLSGLTPYAARGVTLSVQGGQVDLDGPPVVHKVGGPAKLSVDHNNVVVTSRLGKLSRILGPGVHNLQAFERVWDVVDIRPQRRTVTVKFVTRDGIPAFCQASIICRIASSRHEEFEGAMPPFGYSERAVLKVTTSKSVRKHEGRDRVSDWVTGMSMGVLDSAVRDVLEQYRLDEYLNPRYWLEEDDVPAPKLLLEFEVEIERIVRDKGAERGVIVERIELGMIRPAEEAISRQWLEFWQAKLQKNIDVYPMDAATDLEQLAEDARVEAQVRFITRMLEEVQGLISDEVDVPPQLIIATFLKVLYAVVSDQGPEQQRLFISQAEDLMRVATTTPQDPQSPPTAELPTGPQPR
jgi:hypothetical protein